MKENSFYVLRFYLNNGASNLRSISKATSISLGSLSKIIKELKEDKLIDDKGITEKGKDALKPFEVNNAIIMAAGMSTRLAPLSFDKPKGLFEIKGEILIERQIKQLKDAGIDDITLVLGYKKESFFYLG
ncbi:MAG: NTP transferase domain-containing protein, partial [Bacilli bacterium]|nr:NTP transferase domain-containing protein [Bacilli bacterium]